LIPLVTIGETYFFRNPNHIKALTDYIIPQLSQKKPSINILSAGCSTGEEPYTLSMLFKELFPLVHFQITATDIDTEALLKAQQGLYQKRALMKTPEIYVQNFFHTLKNGYQIRPEIRKCVSFVQSNLTSRSFYDTLGLFDLIICRNVLIYFAIPTIKKIISSLRGIIQDDGFLILGHSETLRGISDEFDVIEKSNAFFYEPIKEHPSGIENTADIGDILIPESPGQTVVDPMPGSPLSSPENDQHAVEAEKELKPFDPEMRYQQGIRYIIDDNEEKAAIIFKDILHHLPDHIHSLLCMAMIEANRGNTREAGSYCARAFAVEEFSAHAHYITGLLHDVSGKKNKAKKAYEDAIFLETNFTPAHFKLAQLNHTLRQEKDAAKSYTNTLRCLEQESPDTLAVYLGGFSKKSIQSICKNKIETMT